MRCDAMISCPAAGLQHLHLLAVLLDDGGGNAHPMDIRAHGLYLDKGDRTDADMST